MVFLRNLLNAVFTLIIGCVIGYTVKTLNGASPAQVRQAMYVACALGPNYDPTETKSGSYCSRHSIDIAIANTYGRSAVPPMVDAAEIQAYEQKLLDMRQSP